MLFIINSEKLNNNQKIIASLFIFLPLLLITGPFLSDLAVSIAAIYFLFNFKTLNINFNNKYITIFFLFYFCTVLNSFNFDYFFFSLKSFLFYFRFLCFILIISYLIKKEVRIIDDFFKICFFSFIIVIVSGFIQYLDIRFEYFTKLADLEYEKYFDYERYLNESRKLGGTCFQ